MMLRLALIGAILWLPGCATILGHNDHSMKVTSTPAGASVYLNGAPMGATPVEFRVKDLGTPNTLKIRLEGHQDESQRVLRQVQTVAFCNLFSIICWGIDYLSDSMFEIKNDVLHFDLRPAVDRLPTGPAPPPFADARGPTSPPAPPPIGAEAADPTAPVEAVSPEELQAPPEPEGESFVPPPELSAPPLVSPDPSS